MRALLTGWAAVLEPRIRVVVADAPDPVFRLFPGGADFERRALRTNEDFEEMTARLHGAGGEADDAAADWAREEARDSWDL